MKRHAKASAARAYGVWRRRLEKWYRLYDTGAASRKSGAAMSSPWWMLRSEGDWESPFARKRERSASLFRIRDVVFLLALLAVRAIADRAAILGPVGLLLWGRLRHHVGGRGKKRWLGAGRSRCSRPCDNGGRHKNETHLHANLPVMPRRRIRAADRCWSRARQMARAKRRWLDTRWSTSLQSRLRSAEARSVIRVCLRPSLKGRLDHLVPTTDCRPGAP